MNKEYDREMLKLKDQFNGKFVTVSLDGWSTDKNILVMGAACDEELVSSKNTTGQPHTADFVKDTIEQTVCDVEKKLEVVVAGVVTDSAANMAAAREALQGRPYITYACQAHLANLVVKDYLSDKNREATLSIVVEVIKKFRGVHALSADLKTRGLPRPPLPCATRWGAYQRVLLYYNRQWAHLASIAASHLKINDPTRCNLENAQVSRAVLDMLKFMTPVCEALDHFQAQSTHIGMAVEV